MNDQKPQIIIRESNQTYGLLSIIFGFIGIFILSPILSPLAFILGLISITKKEFVSGIIGIIFAIIGVLTSPILMALIHATTINFIDIEKIINIEKGTVL